MPTYKFFGVATVNVFGFVTARSKKQAQKKILAGDVDDILDSTDLEVIQVPLEAITQEEDE